MSLKESLRSVKIHYKRVTTSKGKMLDGFGSSNNKIEKFTKYCGIIRIRCG